MNEKIKEMSLSIRALRAEGLAVVSVADDVLARFEAVEQRLADLRDAIAAWKPYSHRDTCSLCDYGSYVVTCGCGADKDNAVRTHARRVAGLED